MGNRNTCTRRSITQPQETILNDTAGAVNIAGQGMPRTKYPKGNGPRRGRCHSLLVKAVGRSLHLFDHHKIPDAGTFGMGKRRLIGRRMIAIDRRLKTWKAGNDIAGPIIPFKLNISAAAGKENTSMRGNGRPCLLGISAIGIGIRDGDMGNPECGRHVLTPLSRLPPP